MRASISLLFIVAGLCGLAGRDVAAKLYPQRFVKFFALDSPELSPTVRRALEPDARPPEPDARPPELPDALRLRRAALPVGGSFTVVVSAPGGWYWLGSRQGAMRCEPNPAERCDYFAGLRYLPDDEVVAIYPESARFTWIRTRSGVARLEFRPMTLDQKAKAFEERIRLRHDRYGLIGTSELVRPGDLSSNRMFPNDNDGLWSAIYIGAQAFRYAATKDPQARRLARASLDALMRLEQITGIPGFPARAYIRAGDYRHADGEWHATPDGRFEWKGDTSSDEIVGHYFAYSVYYDLVADAGERRAIAAVITRITNHLLDHGRYLVDVDGKPTTWGRWSPEYFRDKQGLGWCDSPLNALELLSFVKTAHHITGDARYAAEHRKLVGEGYADIAAQRLNRRCELNYSDEELAMLSFYPLFEYERDAALRGTYLKALEQWWENLARQQNPLWTYIYDRATGRRVFLAEAERTLARHPMDLVNWTVRNSHRADIRPAGTQDRFGKDEFVDLLPPDERPVMRWNANPFRVDGGDGGRTEDDGAAYLLPYWMGRYYGYVE